MLSNPASYSRSIAETNDALYLVPVANLKTLHKISPGLHIRDQSPKKKNMHTCRFGTNATLFVMDSWYGVSDSSCLIGSAVAPSIGLWTGRTGPEDIIQRLMR